MKKTLGIIVLGLLLSGNANTAEIKILKDTNINSIHPFGLTILCIDGLKFITTNMSKMRDGRSSSSISTVQVFEQRQGGESLPARCSAE